MKPLEDVSVAAVMLPTDSPLMLESVNVNVPGCCVPLKFTVMLLAPTSTDTVPDIVCVKPPLVKLTEMGFADISVPATTVKVLVNRSTLTIVSAKVLKFATTVTVSPINDGVAARDVNAAMMDSTQTARMDFSFMIAIKKYLFPKTVSPDAGGGSAIVVPKNSSNFFICDNLNFTTVVTYRNAVWAVRKNLRTRPFRD